MRLRYTVLIGAASAALFVATAHAQTAAKRDSAVADSLVRLRPWLNGWRLTTLNNQITTLRSPLVTPPTPIPIPPTPTPPPPTAALGTSCLFLVCSFSASGSTGVKPTYAWDCGALPNCAPGSVTAFTFTYPHEGPRTATLTVRDSLGRTAVSSKTFTVTAPVVPPVDTVSPPLPVPIPPTPVDTSTVAARAELPRVIPNPVFAKATRTIQVPAGADLQAAVNAAQSGDSLSLAAGATYNPILLPQRQCGAGISIVGAAPIPAAGVRVDTVSAKRFPKIVIANSAQAIRTTNPTCGWRISGVEVIATASAGVPGTSLNYGIVWLGDGGWVAGGENQTTLAQVPSDIVLDHVWIHGTATTNTTRCVKLDSRNTIIRDSWLSDCHADGSDSQAILMCNGPGPFLIENNHLEGAGENIMAGGCDPADSTMIPSDITIRRNHIIKPLSWKGKWSIKNLTEFKDARRVDFDANVAENSWPASQAGMCLVIKSSTETSPVTWEGSKDITIRNSIFRNCHRGLNVQAVDQSSAGLTASHTERVTILNSLFDSLGTANSIPPSDGWHTLLVGDIKDLTIRNNTFRSNTPGYGLAIYLDGNGGAAKRLDYSLNANAGLSYYALAGQGGNHTAALNGFASTWRFAGNCIAQIEQQYWSLMPAGNQYATALPMTCAAGVGADLTVLAQKTAGVVLPN